MNRLIKLSIVLILYSLLCMPYSVFHIPSSYAANNEFSLGIYPTTIQIDAENGSKPEATINIENKSKEEVTLIPTFRIFTDSHKHNGEIEYISDKDLDESEKELLNKLKIYDADQTSGEAGISTNKITLLPYQTKELKLNIDLGQSQGRGDYYFSVIFTTEAKNQLADESVTQITPGIATNIILSIGKKDIAAGSIEEYKSPSLLFTGPIPITLLIANNGKNSFIPSGEIVFKNMFGRRIGITQIKPGIIPSGAKRYLTSQDNKLTQEEALRLQNKYQINNDVMTWNDKFLFGIYTADLRIQLSPTTPAFERSINFIVLPIYMIGIITVILFIGLSIYIKAKRKTNQ